MNVFLIENPTHYINLVSQQVMYRDLRDHPVNKELIGQQAALATACCKTRREIIQNMEKIFEDLVVKITTEETEVADKIARACNCKELVFTCLDIRNNVKKEIRYERQD